MAVSIAVAETLAALYYRHSARYPDTGDAHVVSDVVPVAAQVAGPIVNPPIVDDQAAQAGGLLFEIAQRFPVRVAFVDRELAHPLRKGMRATVRIDTTGESTWDGD